MPIWAQNAQRKSWKWPGRIKARAQGSSGITGRQQVPKYHAKNHGRRDGHALRPEAGGENQPGSCMWRKLLGDCWGKCKQIQAVNRTVLFTVDYKNRCTICIFASIYLFLDDSGQQIPATT